MSDGLHEGLTAYIWDNYGQCRLGDACECRRAHRWLGRGCEHWFTVPHMESWAEMREWLEEKFERWR